jgi:cytochrome c-type biogenesis protein
MDIINGLIDNYNIPILSAFLIGILASISPCTLATNVTAIAFVSREISTTKNILLNGLFYTIGRGVSYTTLALLIYFGFSSFQIAGIFQGWGDKILGPILILVGLVMFNVIKIRFEGTNEIIEKTKFWLSNKGYLGALVLGMLFALAFCPYSGVLFFGALMPLVLKTTGGVFLPPFFAIGTGLSVLLFSFLLAFGVQKLSQAFFVVQKCEKPLRYFVALIFILSGVYYLQFLVRYLIGNL